MRQEFLDTLNRREAVKMAPWAAVVTRCEGGFRAFESLDDAKVWRNQK